MSKLPHVEHLKEPGQRVLDSHNFMPYPHQETGLGIDFLSPLEHVTPVSKADYTFSVEVITLGVTAASSSSLSFPKLQMN